MADDRSIQSAAAGSADQSMRNAAGWNKTIRWKWVGVSVVIIGILLAAVFACLNAYLNSRYADERGIAQSMFRDLSDGKAVSGKTWNLPKNLGAVDRVTVGMVNTTTGYQGTQKDISGTVYFDSGRSKDFSLKVSKAGESWTLEKAEFTDNWGQN